MPIVFWASFEPWLKAMNAAETTWSRRNRSLIRRGFARRNTFRITTMSSEADRDPEDRRQDERAPGPCRRRRRP